MTEVNAVTTVLLDIGKLQHLHLTHLRGLVSCSLFSCKWAHFAESYDTTSTPRPVCTSTSSHSSTRYVASVPRKMHPLASAVISCQQRLKRTSGEGVHVATFTTGMFHFRYPRISILGRGAFFEAIKPSPLMALVTMLPTFCFQGHTFCEEAWPADSSTAGPTIYVVKPFLLLMRDNTDD
jgi:hypothetical protein